MSTRQELKNERIKQTYVATRQRRRGQVALTFRFKVRNEKRNNNVGIFESLKMILVEGKWVWNSIVAQSDRSLGDSARKLSSFNQKEFDTVVHKDADGNDVTDSVTHLKSSMRDDVITRAKSAVKGLSTKKKKNEGK